MSSTQEKFSRTSGEPASRREAQKPSNSLPSNHEVGNAQQDTLLDAGENYEASDARKEGQTNQYDFVERDAAHDNCLAQPLVSKGGVVTGVVVDPSTLHTQKSLRVALGDDDFTRVALRYLLDGRSDFNITANSAVGGYYLSTRNDNQSFYDYIMKKRSEYYD